MGDMHFVHCMKNSTSALKSCIQTNVISSLDLVLYWQLFWEGYKQNSRVLNGNVDTFNVFLLFLPYNMQDK